MHENVSPSNLTLLRLFVRTVVEYGKGISLLHAPTITRQNGILSRRLSFLYSTYSSLTAWNFHFQVSPSQGIKLNAKVTVTVCLTNPLPIDLTNGKFHLEFNRMEPKTMVVDCK